MTSIANQELLNACLEADSAMDLLKAARANGDAAKVSQLEVVYDKAVDKVNALWDAWNDSLTVERLARMRA